MQYTGDFTELTPTEAGIEALGQSLLDNSLLLNSRGLLRNIVERLHHRNVVTFADSELWDTIVPILADKMGLQHKIIPRSSPYYPRGILRVRYAGMKSKKLNSQPGELHVLINPGKIPPDLEDVPEALVEVVQKCVRNQSVEYWLRDFRLHIDRPDYPVWKVFMLLCRDSPPAMPRLEIIPRYMAGSKKTTSGRSPQLRLINDKYGILVLRCLDEKTTISEAIINQALLEYVQALHKAYPSDTDYPFQFGPGVWQPAEFLARALSALGWGDVKFEETALTSLVPTIPSNDVWQFTIHTPKHGPLNVPTIWYDKRLTRLLALVSACDVVKDHLEAAYKSGRLVPEEYRIFARYWDKSAPEVVPTDVVATAEPSLESYKVTINQEIVARMLETLRNLLHAGFQSTYNWTDSEEVGLQISRPGPRAVPRIGRLDRLLHRAYLERGARPADDTLHLPIRSEEMSSSIIQAIEDHDVTIITAATGSGKTTQVPQMILDEYIAAGNGSLCSIVCTQPRRVSAISVANRVASERQQPLGREVGYKVRFDQHPTEAGRGVTYMTSGYLSRLLEVDSLELLNQYSHVILDEVHARDVDTDLVLTHLKNHLGNRTFARARKMPKIILMSATINAGFFQTYFEELGSNAKVTTINVPGKMYAVEHKNLDHILSELQDSDPQHLSRLLADPDTGRYVKEQTDFTVNTSMVITDTDKASDAKNNDVTSTPRDLFVPISLIHLMLVRLLSASDTGDILVFMPGLGEIEALETLLLNDSLSQHKVSNLERFRIFKLHSALYQTNYDVFEEIPSGCRRIVLATNIAETSITLPGVRFVIDTGLSRQNTFDQVTQSGTFGLQWISKAEIVQRKGRAGRTQAGVYYGLYSQARYDAMSDAPTPEILRVSLDQLVLRCASSQSSQVPSTHWPQLPGIEDVQAGHVLLTTPSPPEMSYVAAAGRQLHYIHALAANGKPTPMGLVLSALPLTPTAAKTVLLGMIFRCFDSTLIAGAMREDSPLMYDPAGIGGTAERRRKLANGTDDDKWADTQAFFGYNEAIKQENWTAVNDIKAKLSIRHDAFCEYAQITEQTYDTIFSLLYLRDEDQGSQEDDQKQSPLFPTTPRALNINSTNADLVKALAFSTSGTRFACWKHKNWRAQLHSRVLPHPKSVNHNGSKRTILAQRLRRENGDLLSYATMRTIRKDKYPWLHDTSAITPMMAILFAESVSLVEGESAFLINGWVKYELIPSDSNQDVTRAAKIIWEYRKAVDRFMAYAMQMVSLEPHKIVKVQSGEVSIRDFNVFLQRKDHPIRKLIVDSVVEVLKIDSKDRKDRTIMRVLEDEGVEPDVVKELQEAGGLEEVIDFVLSRSKNSSSVVDILKRGKPMLTASVSDGSVTDVFVSPIARFERARGRGAKAVKRVFVERADEK